MHYRAFVQSQPYWEFVWQYKLNNNDKKAGGHAGKYYRDFQFSKVQQDFFVFLVVS